MDSRRLDVLILESAASSHEMLRWDCSYACCSHEICQLIQVPRKHAIWSEERVIGFEASAEDYILRADPTLGVKCMLDNRIGWEEVLLRNTNN